MTTLTMTEAPPIRTQNMPGGMDQLLKELPRDQWDTHPGFAQATRNWLGAHKAFRRLSRFLHDEAQAYLDKSRDGEKYADHLAYYGNALVGNLYGHHHWEDMEYFPELSAADPRFDKGLSVLEEDHHCLNAWLEKLTLKANRVIKLMQLDEPAALDEAGDLEPVLATIADLLDRHLSDEEDLAVPIILHHRLRG